MAIDKEVTIKGDYIKLDNLLKFSGAVAIGSDAKEYIKNGKVLYNGETCLMRGKKCFSGDVICFDGFDIKIL